jgi:hypothetical protein
MANGNIMESPRIPREKLKKLKKVAREKAAFYLITPVVD